MFNVYSFVMTLYDRFDVVLLSKLAGSYATGVYVVAYRALALTQIVPYAVLYSLLPSLSRDWNHEGEQSRFRSAIRLLLSAAFIVTLATFVFAGPAVRLVLGPGYAESAVALKILIWAVILRYANYALNTVLLAAGRERVFMSTFLLCLAVNFFGNLIFIPKYSWRAAAVLTIVTELVLLVQNIYWIRMVVGEVGVPSGVARTSFVFSILLGAFFAGGYLASPLVVGAACLLVFATYLYRSGMLGEFTAIWMPGELQQPNPAS